jgi:hypothetical protein
MQTGGGGRWAEQVEGTLRSACLHRVDCLGVYEDLFGRYCRRAKASKAAYVRLAPFRR